MKLQWKNWELAGAVSFMVVSLIMTGCAGLSQKNAKKTAAPKFSDTLQVGDYVEVDFSGVANPPDKHEEHIKDDGSITLPWIGPVKAAGLTSAQLQNEIYTNYVPKYFRSYLTVTVKSENRVVYVDGEVKNPSRQVYMGKMTVLKAINAAGGFTDFAKRTRVQVIRANGDTLIVNCDKAQEDPLKYDVPIYPNDHIIVPRRIF